MIGVEPEGSRALHAALAAGAAGRRRRCTRSPPIRSARAASARSISRFAATAVDRVALVRDEAIRAAQRALWREFNIVAEPGGAAAYAALASGAYRPAPGERVGVLLCGANADLAALAG